MMEQEYVSILTKIQNYVKYMKFYRSKNKKQAMKYYLKSIDLSLGLKGFQFRRILFVYVNRILKKN